MRRSPTRHLHAHPIALAGYVLLALLLTLPLAAHFGSHVPGDGIDAPPLAWNLWWVKHALLQLRNPFDCDYLFYPIKINLAFYTLTVLNGALSIPLQLVFGLIPAVNLTLLSSYVLSGWGAFLLSEHLLADLLRQRRRPLPADWTLRLHAAAFVGGFIYAFASSKMFFAGLGQFNITSSQWIPFCVLFLFKMRQSPGRVLPPVMAGLFLVLQTWAEMTYASFLLIFAVLFFGYHMLSGRGAKTRGNALLGLAAMLVIFAAGVAPILITMLPDLAAEGNFMVQGSGFAEEYSSDVLGLVVPTQLHPLLGGLVAGLNFPHDKGQHLFLGIATGLLAVYGLVAWRRRGLVRFWAAATLGFLLLTLGPAMRVNGTALSIPLPFAVLQRLPFFNGNRYPGRISVMVVLGLGVLAAFGLWALFRRVPRRVALQPTYLGAIVLALLAFEHLSAPLPTVELAVPEVYRRQIARDPEDGVLLDLPVAWRSGFRVTGTMDPIIMHEQFYQTVHGKRILAGNTSRNPEYKFQYFTELPVINRLIALETGRAVAPADIEADRLVAGSLLRFLNVRWIVVHPNRTGPGMIPYIEATMPVERVSESPDLVAYRVKPEPGDPDAEPIIDLGEPLAAAHLGEGWGEAYVTDGYVWAQRDGARLMVRLDDPKQAGVMLARVWAPGQRQVLRVDVNGRLTPPVDLAEGWGEYRIELPQDALVSGLNRLKLRFSREFPIASVLPQGLPLGESNINVAASIVAKSAGKEIGDFAHIFVNGANVAPEGIGYNLVALDPATGEVADRRAFNTFASESASREMANWIEALPVSSVIVAAVRDEASMRLDGPGVEVLRSLGMDADLRGRFRWSHAAIGAPGLAPGQAVEDVEEIRPATVRLGLGVTEPQVTAAFDWIRFVRE